jgi:NAD(P)-dependent dehydrogenase (short-subunit alcohol dehydrogenase family)
LLKQKRIKNKGSIVFTSSISGLVCSEVGESLYSASKAAINGFVKGAAIELATKGIRLNTVNPGLIDTNIFDEGIITKEQLEEKKKRYPLRRFGKPEEVAYAIIYFLSDASLWTTGANLIIDGGYTLI